MKRTEFKTLGARICLVRMIQNISQSQLAKNLGVHVLTVSKYERSEIVPCLDIIVKLSTTYNVNLNWLILGGGEMKGNQL